MRYFSFIVSLLVLTCTAFASSNSGVRNVQPVRVPVIMVQYQDVQFKAENDEAGFADFFNGTNYSHAGATGSVKKYFADQSFGLYVPEFDVIGVVTLDGNRRDYGANDGEGEDISAEQMVANACNLAEDMADFTKYDMDGDGRLDAVVIVYAGQGEQADNHQEEAIWPHYDDLETTFALDYLVQLDGKTVAKYCAVPELQNAQYRDGIGTLIHEFAHILGLPNFCTTDGGTQKTLGDYDVMDHGSYNNKSRTPAAMSAYERFYLGWVEPILLDDKMNVRLGDLNTTGDCAIITADGQSNLNGLSPDPREFYILENRQQSGWDAYIPGHGLMLTKIDFVKNKWESDEVNNVEKHPCVDLIEADGRKPSYKADNLMNGYFGKQGDLFPAGATECKMFSNKMYFDNVIEQDGIITFDFLGGVEKCTVTFSVSNGTCSTTSLTESKKGAGVILPSVTANSGYTFLGWATRKNSTVADAGQAGERFYPMSDCSVFAVMQDNTKFWVNYDLKGVEIGDYIDFNGAYVKANAIHTIGVTFGAKEGYLIPNEETCQVRVACAGKQLSNAVRFDNDSIYITIPAEAITGDMDIVIVNTREQHEDGCVAYSYTFTSAVRAGSAQDFGPYTWDVTIANDNACSYDKNKGAVFGSGTYPAGLVTLRTDETVNCAPAVIRVKAAANGDGVLSVFVGGNQVGEAAELETTLEEYIFVADEPTSGALEIRMENTMKAMYLKHIDVEFEYWEDPDTAVEAVDTDKPSMPTAKKFIRNGQLYIMHNGCYYNVLGTNMK